MHSYHITKTFSFDAAHYLQQLPPDHKCSHLHGHTWKVAVSVYSRSLNEQGFVIDFNELATYCRDIQNKFDHKLLNDAVDFVTTAERLAQFIYVTIQENLEKSLGADINTRVTKVQVWETPDNCASYSWV